MKLIILLFVFTGCFRTAEQVQREQKLDNIDNQMKESQNLVADITVILKEMQSKIDQISGKVEEVQHAQKNVKAEDISQIQSDMKLVQEQLLVLQKDQETLKSRMDEKATAAKSQKKSNSEVTLHEAEKAINKKKWGQASEILDQLLSQESNPAQTNKIYHAYGDLEFRKGDFDKSLVYFSKIFTKYPKSSLAPSSLYFIGLSLKKLRKNDEAKQAFDEFAKLYPGHKLAKKVEDEKKSI